uniref:Uncharacterized protein n=1 Tax=Nymphaea colorata TaxID=210225 RepID=A0A5K0XZW2_9MAGN
MRFFSPSSGLSFSRFCAFSCFFFSSSFSGPPVDRSASFSFPGIIQ